MVMIKSVHFKNFFSFKDCKVDLNRLNVLVGINGVGKSNFIKALRVLKATVLEGALQDLILNQWGGFDAMFFSGNKTVDDAMSNQVELEFEFEQDKLFKYGYHFQEPVYYQISFRKVASSQNFSIFESFHTKHEDTGKRAYRYLQMANGKGYAREGLSADQHTVRYQLDNVSESLLSQLVDKDRYFQIYTLREAIKDIAVYNYFDTTAHSAIRKPMLPTGSIRLSPDGSNLPQILNRIKINSKLQDYPKIIASLHNINPHYVGIDFDFLGSNIELLLDEKGLDKAVHVTHISDGTLRFLCLLSIIFNAQRGAVVCIDEPEVGLHPDMIMEVIGSIHQNNTDTQYVISTHSEHILNDVPVNDLLVFEKADDNNTVVNVFRDKEFVEWASQYSTGKLWRNGDLGGNRY